MNGLMLHCGAQKLERDMLTSIETPTGTRTHRPIAHSLFVAKIVASIEKQGYRILSEAHGVSKDGMVAYGTFHVAKVKQTIDVGGMSFDVYDDDSKDYGLIIGYKNANDKSSAAIICSGIGVFICDNGTIMAETKVSKKHTMNMMDIIDQKIDEAVGRVMGIKGNMDKRVEHYQDVAVGKMQTSDLIVKAIDQDIVGVRQFKNLVAECKNPRHREFTDWNAWSTYNCFTEILKCNMEQLPDRTNRLTQMFDQEFSFDPHKVIESTNILAV